MAGELLGGGTLGGGVGGKMGRIGGVGGACLKYGGQTLGKGIFGGWDRGEMVTYGSGVGSGGEWDGGRGNQSPHPLSQNTRKKDGATKTAGAGYFDTEAARGDGGGGVSGEGGGLGVPGVEAVGGEFAVRPDCG